MAARVSQCLGRSNSASQSRGGWPSISITASTVGVITPRDSVHRNPPIMLIDRDSKWAHVEDVSHACLPL